MVILFVGLMTGIIKLESVREAGKFFDCDNACYVYTCRSGTYVILGSVKPVLIPVSIITIACVFTVMGVNGVVDSVPYTIKNR